MDDDRRRWDERYEGHPGASPSMPEALAGRDDLLALVPTSGRALDVACGPGPTALWAAARGLDVLALDVSPVAVALLERRARELGVAARIEARVVDLDAGLPPGAAGCDLVVCQRFRGVDLYPRLLAAARPGGLVVVTVLSTVGAADPGPFHAEPGELIATFQGLGAEVLHHVEADGVASVVVRA
jgi:SAM-dependent methyltransferase